MRQRSGNIWSANGIICITTNGVIKSNGAAVMGAGIAKQARDKFPGVDFCLGKRIKNYGLRTEYLGRNLVALPTKHDWRDHSDIDLIIESVERLVYLTDNYNWTEVNLTPPGCGLGQLSWHFVGSKIEPILDDRFTVWNYVKGYR